MRTGSSGAPLAPALERSLHATNRQPVRRRRARRHRARAAAAGARVLDNTTIVLGTSIGKATVGTSKTKLDGRLGPGSRDQAHDQRPRPVHDRALRRPPRRRHVPRLAVGARDDDEPHYGTTKGIYVTATKADLKRTYPAAKCPTATLCTLGRFKPGNRVTEFRLKRGTITSIGVGIVLD